MSDWTHGDYTYRDELIYEIRLIWSHFPVRSPMEEYYELENMTEVELEVLHVAVANEHFRDLRRRIEEVSRPGERRDAECRVTGGLPLPLAVLPAALQRAILDSRARRVLHPFYRRGA